MGKNIGKNISKNLGGKYSQRLCDHIKYPLQMHLKIFEEEQFKKQLKEPVT